MRVSPAEYETVPECCKLSHKIKLYQKLKKFSQVYQKPIEIKKNSKQFSTFSSHLRSLTMTQSRVCCELLLGITSPAWPDGHTLDLTAIKE